MRFRTIWLFLLLALPFTLQAQDVREVLVRYEKGNRPALQADYNLPADQMMAALDEHLMRKSPRYRNNAHDFTVYETIIWNEVSMERLNVHVRIEGKSGYSTLTILLSKGNSFISYNSDPGKIQNLKNFFARFEAIVSLYDLRKRVEAQEAMVKKAEQMYEKSQENVNALLREKEELEADLRDGFDDQKNKETLLDLERQKLALLRQQLPGGAYSTKATSPPGAQ